MAYCDPHGPYPAYQGDMEAIGYIDCPGCRRERGLAPLPDDPSFRGRVVSETISVTDSDGTRVLSHWSEDDA